MDRLAKRNIAELALLNMERLKSELVKARRTLVAAKKKSYFRVLMGTLLYDLSVLFGVGN